MRANQKGEFEPFNMLIGAIMALVVLVIILGAIDFFYSFKISVSTEKFYNGLKNAVEQPNGKTLEIKGLLFDEETVFSSSAISRQIGLTGPQCLEFEGPDNSQSIIVSSDNRTVQLKNSLEIDAFVQCFTNTMGVCESTCEVCCVVGFNIVPST